MSTVHPETVACLTAEFEMGSGEPSPYDRPIGRNSCLFISFSLVFFKCTLTILIPEQLIVLLMINYIQNKKKYLDSAPFDSIQHSPVI